MNLNEMNAKVTQIERIKGTIKKVIDYCEINEDLEGINIITPLLQEKLEEVDSNLQDLKNNSEVSYNMEYIDKMLNERLSNVE